MLAMLRIHYECTFQRRVQEMLRASAVGNIHTGLLMHLK